MHARIDRSHPGAFIVSLPFQWYRLKFSMNIFYLTFLFAVNFRNCVCIFTSNVGSQDILDLNGVNPEAMRERVTNAMRDKFKPEFLNRIDENVIFNSLSKADLREIVKIEAKRLETRLADRSITMAMSEAALDHLADVGFDPVYGARPLKRTIQRELETAISIKILSGEFNDGDTIVVDVSDDDKIEVRKAIDGNNQSSLSNEDAAAAGGFD